MKKLIVIFLAGLFLMACNETILDKMPLDSINDATLWSDPKLIDAFLTQIYGEITVFDKETSTRYAIGFSDQYDDVKVGMFRIDYLSDECRIGWGKWVTGNQAGAKFGGIKIQGGVLEFWAYNTIRKVNEFIERLPSSPLAEDLKKLRIAEARFLRAFIYFSMVKRYGGVPLITKVQQITDPEEELYPKRNSEEEIYNYVLSELDLCLPDLLSTSKTEKGRPSKAAALALKSRAALYAGSIARYGKIQLNGLLGIAPSKANDYFKISLDASQAIIDGKEHSLYTKNLPDYVKNYQNLFTDKWNTEIIFARDHNAISLFKGGVGTGYDFWLAPAPNAWGYGNCLAPYLDMLDEYENNDGTPGKLDRAAIQQGLWTVEDLWGKKEPRFFATIYTQGTPWQGSTLDFHRGLRLADGSITMESVAGIPAYGLNYRKDEPAMGTSGVLKYLNPTFNNKNQEPISNVALIVFRYGEILLNHAEAAFETGKTDIALNAINQIRSRAGVPPLTQISMDKIKHERKIELAFEGHRYWDIRRWRTAVNDLTRYFAGLRYILDVETKKLQLQVIENDHGSITSPTFYEYNYYLPITLARTGSNPNLVENPGY